MAVAILVAGGVASAVGGILWRRSVASQDTQSFRSTAADVTATLSSMLRRNDDFIATLRALVATQPDLRESALQRWYGLLQGRQRQVGGLATAVVRNVPLAQLAAFQARRRGDAQLRALTNGRLSVSPAGRRPHYCLVSSAVVLSTDIQAYGAELGRFDWCQPLVLPGAASRTLPTQLNTQRDSGRFTVEPFFGTLFEGAAVYRPGAQTRTVQQRRAAVTGWISASFDVPQLVQLALGSHHGLNVSVYHRNPTEATQLVGVVGDPTNGGATTGTHTVSLESGTWSVRIRGHPSAGLSPTAQGVIFGVIGLALTIMAVAVIVTLGSTRARALALVEEKTRQLRHQALHDPLTDLPNRTLGLETAEQMLARAPRHGTEVAALYVDLDGFKGINDTFGHAAGDRLLRDAAQRLKSSVRGSDAVARLAGDEFLVLIEAVTDDDAPEQSAKRLLAALRQPWHAPPPLDEAVSAVDGASERDVSVTASVGIARGVGCSAEQLLRDADLALYDAKSRGKNTYAVFGKPRRRAAHAVSQRGAPPRRAHTPRPA